MNNHKIIILDKKGLTQEFLDGVFFGERGLPLFDKRKEIKDIKSIKGRYSLATCQCSDVVKRKK